MKKKFLASLLTLCMVLALLPTAALAEDPPLPPSPVIDVKLGMTALEDGCYYVAAGGGTDPTVTKVANEAKGDNYFFYEKKTDSTATLTVEGGIDLPKTNGAPALLISNGTLTLTGSGHLYMESNNFGGILISGRGSNGSLKTENYSGNLSLNSGGGECAIDLVNLTLETTDWLDILSSDSSAPTIEATGAVTLRGSRVTVWNKKAGTAIKTNGAISVTATTGDVELITAGATLFGGTGATTPPPALSANDGKIFQATSGGTTITIGDATYVYGGQPERLDFSTPPTVATYYAMGTESKKFALYTPASDRSTARLELHDAYIAQETNGSAALKHNGDLILALIGASRFELDDGADGVQVTGNLTLAGSGRLDIIGASDIVTEGRKGEGVSVTETLTVWEDATLTVKLAEDEDTYGTEVVCKNLVVDGTLTARLISQSGATPAVVGGTLNALLAVVTDPQAIACTSYGAAMLNEREIEAQSLTVSAGSTLTVVPRGALVIEDTLTIEEGGSIVNEGKIILPGATTPDQIKAYGFVGNGRVQAREDPDSPWYNNAGAEVRFREDPLYFTVDSDDDGDLEADGYHWEKATKTMTIKDLFFENDTLDAIKLPAGATLVVQGSNVIIAESAVSGGGALTILGEQDAQMILHIHIMDNRKNAIYSDGDVTVSGDMAFTVDGAFNCISSAGTVTLDDNVTFTASDVGSVLMSIGDITVGGNAAITASDVGAGICTGGIGTMNGNARVIISDVEEGITAGDGVTIGGHAVLTVNCGGLGIGTEGTLTIEDNAEVTIDDVEEGITATGNVTMGGSATVAVTTATILAVKGDGDITIADDATLTVDDVSAGILIDGDLTIADGATFTADDVSAGIIIDGNLTIDGTVTIHAAMVGINADTQNVAPVVAITGGTTTITTSNPGGAAIVATVNYDAGTPDSIVPVADVLKFADGALPATHALASLADAGDIIYSIIPAGGALVHDDEKGKITGAAPSVTLKVPVDVTAIDSAIAAANLAKTDITVNEGEAGSMASGTKFVNAAELKALTDAIQTATDAKDTVRNAQQAADAAAALNTAVSTFQAAIKTGTYVPYTGGNTRPTPKPEPPKTDPITGNTEVSVSVKPVTKGDTSSATVPDKSIQNAIASAEKEAEKTGGSSSVTVNVNAPESAKTVETTLSSKSLTAVADGKTKGLKISTPVADLFFDDLALKTITASAGKDVKISASRVGTDGLTDTQKEQVGDAPVFDFTVTSDGKTISDFGGGTVTVTIPYTPKDGENPEFVTVWLLDDAGKLIPVEAKYADGKITFTTGHFSRYAIGYLPFTDVKAGWAYESIVYAYQNKLFVGMGENKFAPDANMNRAMLWSVLYRMAGSPDKSETPATWYADAQKWVIANGISDGANPEGNVTREQLATILFRYAKATAVTADMSKFTDTNGISEFAKDGMTWAVECKILQGNEGKLNPQGTATRAEVATMLQRFAGMSK